MENTITWLPKQDNIVEGKLGDTKFYIKLKVVGIFTLQALGIEPEPGKREKEIVDSLYIIYKDRPSLTGPEKTMANEYGAYTIDEMKYVAKDLYRGSHFNQL